MYKMISLSVLYTFSLIFITKLSYQGHIEHEYSLNGLQVCQGIDSIRFGVAWLRFIDNYAQFYIALLIDTSIQTLSMCAQDIETKFRKHWS